MMIQSPNGTYVDVTDENRIKGSSVSHVFDFHQNHHHGKAWSVFFEDINPAGANDKFFYFKNNSTVEYSITDIRASCATTTGRLYIKRVIGTPTFTAGADLTPASRNTALAPAMEATIKSDTDTTGLTDDGVLFYMDLDTVSKLYHLRTSSNIIVAPGKAIAFEWGPATGEVTAVVSFTELSSAGAL